MESHSCHNCRALVLKRNKICPRCGTVAKSKPMPLFWFMFTASLFVTYACLDLMRIV